MVKYLKSRQHFQLKEHVTFSHRIKGEGGNAHDVLSYRIDHHLNFHVVKFKVAPKIGLLYVFGVTESEFETSYYSYFLTKMSPKF